MRYSSFFLFLRHIIFVFFHIYRINNDSWFTLSTEYERKNIHVMILLLLLLHPSLPANMEVKLESFQFFVYFLLWINKNIVTVIHQFRWRWGWKKWKKKNWFENLFNYDVGLNMRVRHYEIEIATQCDWLIWKNFLSCQFLKLQGDVTYWGCWLLYNLVPHSYHPLTLKYSLKHDKNLLSNMRNHLVNIGRSKKREKKIISLSIFKDVLNVHYYE